MSDETRTTDSLADHPRAATIRMFRRAARSLRGDEKSILSPAWRTALADMFDAEASTQGEMPNLVDALNAVIEQKSGARSYLQIGLTAAGDMAMLSDTSEATITLALLVLGET